MPVQIGDPIECTVRLGAATKCVGASGAGPGPNAVRPYIADPAAFQKIFKRIIDDETVPEDIPFAVPYEELENRKIKISPKVKSIRGKLNVPRERFHLRGRTTYLWAGL